MYTRTCTDRTITFRGKLPLIVSTLCGISWTILAKVHRTVHYCGIFRSFVLFFLFSVEGPARNYVQTFDGSHLLACAGVAGDQHRHLGARPLQPAPPVPAQLDRPNFSTVERHALGAWVAAG